MVPVTARHELRTPGLDVGRTFRVHAIAGARMVHLECLELQPLMAYRAASPAQPEASFPVFAAVFPFQVQVHAASRIKMRDERSRVQQDPVLQKKIRRRSVDFEAMGHYLFFRYFFAAGHEAKCGS